MLSSRVTRLRTPVFHRYFCQVTNPYTAHVQRNNNFAQVSSSDIDFFKSTLGTEAVATNHEDLVQFNKDWMDLFHGQSKVALKPQSTSELSQILKYCNDKRIAVVPQGGNTGLVGGGVPLFDEVLVSMSRMNKIEKFDKVSGILTCEAGCILQNLNEYVSDRGFVMPLDLGSKGSCQIGGNVATNAGGIRFLRYGSLHGNVLGLECVLPDGTILDSLSNVRKDNTGYDLKQLFIGSEGTLGIVSKVSILTPRKSNCVNLAFLAVKDYSTLLKVLSKARKDLSEIMSAVEFVDRHAVDLVLEHIPQARDPLSKDYPMYMVVETSGSDENHDRQKIENFLYTAMEEEVILDGVLAQDETQMRTTWMLRENIAESLGKAGAVYKYDVSLDVDMMYTLVEELRDILGDRAKTYGYGHLGDGNLHLNVSTPTWEDDVRESIEEFLYPRLGVLNGSISAEHGLGAMKNNKILYSKSKEMVETMKNIKRLFDPNGILNPYKVLPST